MSGHKIAFSSIPEYIQIQIVQKQDFYTFAQFSKTSRDASNITKKIKGRITFPVGEWTINENNGDLVIFDIPDKQYILTSEIAVKIPIRIESEWVGRVRTLLTNKFCEKYTDFCLKTNSITKNIYMKHVVCSFGSFVRLMEAAKIRKIYTLDYSHIFRNYLYVPSLRNLGKLDFTFLMNDSNFLTFKLPSMNASDSCISNKAINQFLKEWLSGKREITDIEICNRRVAEKCNFPETNVDVLFNGIAYSYGETDSAEKNVYTVKKDEHDNGPTVTIMKKVIHRKNIIEGELRRRTECLTHIHILSV